MKKVIKKIIVWGFEYNNVKAVFNDSGICVGGRIPNVGKFEGDSPVAALINGQSDIGSIEE